MKNDTLIRMEKRADYYAEQAYASDFKLAVERREHRTTLKYLTAYRWLALVGWLGMVVVLTMKEI